MTKMYTRWFEELKMAKMYTWWFEELERIFGRYDDQECSSKPSSKAAYHAIIEMNTPP